MPVAEWVLALLITPELVLEAQVGHLLPPALYVKEVVEVPPLLEMRVEE